MEPRADTTTIDCEAARRLVSAAADDELPADEQRVLDQHLGGCTDCAAYADRVAALTRSVRVRAAHVEPDFVARVMDRRVRLGRGGWMRPALAWCGLLVAVPAIPALVLADLDGAPTHIARHVGAFALALGIGFLYVAWRPHRAAGLLPLVAALAAMMVTGAALDMAAGDRSALAESAHLAELVGMVLLWMIAGSPGWDRARDGWRSLRGGRGVPHTTS